MILRLWSYHHLFSDQVVSSWDCHLGLGIGKLRLFRPNIPRNSPAGSTLHYLVPKLQIFAIIFHY